MANFKEIIYNDGKGKSQSCEYHIEITGNAPWYYNAFNSAIGYGRNVKDAKQECLIYLKTLVNDLINFINEIDEKEYK